MPNTYPVLLAAPVPGCSACDSCPSSCIFHRMSAPPMNSPATYTCAAARGHAVQALARDARRMPRGLPSQHACMKHACGDGTHGYLHAHTAGRGCALVRQAGSRACVLLHTTECLTVPGLVAGAPAARWASC